MKIALLGPVAWRTPPLHYGPWEQITSLLADGLVARGVDTTLFATLDSVTTATLDGVCATGYAEDPATDGRVSEALHVAHARPATPPSKSQRGSPSTQCCLALKSPRLSKRGTLALTERAAVCRVDAYPRTRGNAFFFMRLEESMELDSVRDLKQQVLSATVAPLTANVRFRALGVPARPTDDSQQLRTLALGVTRKGKRDYALAVRIQHRGLEGSQQIERIRKQARGEVDVQYIGRVAKRAVPWHQQRNRPLLMGGSIGHFKITAGTLGCFVTATGSDAPFILSNNHVLADENRAKKGDDIIQPGQIDGGVRPADIVAALARVVRMKRIGANLLDCATAAVRSGIGHDHRQLKGLGKLAGKGAQIVDEGTAVAKVGRTTGVTRGRVSAFELDNVVVGYDIGDLRFDNQIEIEGAGNLPFSRGGDSGSLIVDADRLGVALLFAGGDHGGTNGKGLTYAHPLEAVLRALKVDLLW